MNKFAKYVPEELKKLQREHIGAAAEGEGGSGGVLSWNDLPDKPFEVEKSTVTHTLECEPNIDYRVPFIPSFSVGDTVTVIVDGVKYSLVAFLDEGSVLIGDTMFDFYEGECKYGWYMYVYPNHGPVFMGKEAHTIGYIEERCTIDAKCLAPNGHGVFVVEFDDYGGGLFFCCNSTFREIMDAIKAKHFVCAYMAPWSGILYYVNHTDTYIDFCNVPGGTEQYNVVRIWDDDSVDSGMADELPQYK